MAQIAEIIKYEGDNSTFVWKHPLEDFNSLTQLIVHETQEVLFFRNGQALDLLPPGRHTLTTQNIPKLAGILNRVTGDQTPFHCEVYFINKTEQMSIKWGTDSKVQYMEPEYKFPLSIGARGEMSLRVEDSRKLLLKLVGTECFLGREQITDYFRAFLMTRIKNYIAKAMKVQAINIFEIDQNLVEFSEELHSLLIPDFSDYGIVLERFFVTNVLKPDGDAQYEKFKELHFRQYADIAEASLIQRVSVIQAQTEAQRTIIESQALATKRAQERYSYQQERGFTVMEKVADNEGSGSDLRNAAMGIGIGFGAGGAFGNSINEIANQTMSGFMIPVAPKDNFTEVQDDIPPMIRFKDTITPDTKDSRLSDFKEKIDKLSMMKEAGLLTDEEFIEQINRLLDQLIS